MVEEIIDDQRIKEDAEKMQKIHSLIVKLFPDKKVEIDCLNDKISWWVIDKPEPKELKQTKKEKV